MKVARRQRVEGMTEAPRRLLVATDCLSEGINLQTLFDTVSGHLHAELDAWYARAYGLTRDQLRYVLDPVDAKGPDYPSETFRVLKKNEVARFGEYRTARLVLAAYDQLTKHPLAAE
jgi:hypothetical protein